MMDNIKDIYFGVFVHDEYSKLAILKLLQDNNVRIPKGWKKYIHHMTIAFNNGSPQFDILYNMYKDSFGESVKLEIDGIGVSEDAIAVRVNWKYPIANKIPHITVATPPDGKPVNSNKIIGWEGLKKPITIYGKIGHFAK